MGGYIESSLEDFMIKVSQMDVCEAEYKIEEFLCNCLSQSEETLAQALVDIKTKYPRYYSAMMNAFGSIAYFFEDSENRLLRQHANRAIRKMRKEPLIEHFISINGGDIEGVELSNKQGTRFCVFSKEAYLCGGYRYTEFDEFGIYQHTTRDSYEACVREAVKEGFVTRVNGKLEELFSSKTFYK